MAQATRLAGFYRQNDGIRDVLVCDGVPLAAIAAAEGTPLYVYSAAVLRERYQAIDGAFAGYPHAQSAPYVTGHPGHQPQSLHHPP